MKDIFFCSIDEFSVMFYNHSLNDVYDWIDFDRPKFKSLDELKLCSGSLQAMNLDNNIDASGCLISFSSLEKGYLWNSPDVMRDPREAFNIPFSRIRLHCHHDGFYQWFKRYQTTNLSWNSFNQYILGKLNEATGSDDPDVPSIKITRLDIAFDLLNSDSGSAWLDYMINEHLLGHIITSISGKPANCRAVIGGRSGNTLYIGRDAAERKLRVYDKLKERGFFDVLMSGSSLDPYPMVKDLVDCDIVINNWTRFEIECRREQAGQYLVSRPSLGSFLDKPQTAFYNTLKFIHSLEGSDSYRDRLIETITTKEQRQDKFNDFTKIIQNEYSDYDFMHKKMLDSLCIINAYHCLFGSDKFNDVSREFIDQLQDRNSYCSRKLDRIALQYGYAGYLNLPYVQGISKDVGIIFKADPTPEKPLSLEDFKEQLSFI